MKKNLVFYKFDLYYDSRQNFFLQFILLKVSGIDSIETFSVD